MIPDEGLLTHIRDAARRILECTVTGRDRFLQEPMRQDAIIRQIEIIGEATKNLREGLRNAHADVP